VGFRERAQPRPTVRGRCRRGYVKPAARTSSTTASSDCSPPFREPYSQRLNTRGMVRRDGSPCDVVEVSSKSRKRHPLAGVFNGFCTTAQKTRESAELVQKPLNPWASQGRKDAILNY